MLKKCSAVLSAERTHGTQKNSFSSSLLPPEKLKKLEGPGLAVVELAGTVDRDYNLHMNIKSFFLLEMP